MEVEFSHSLKKMYIEGNFISVKVVFFLLKSYLLSCTFGKTSDKLCFLVFDKATFCDL